MKLILCEPLPFVAKVSASVVDGFVFVDRINWDNFNESTDLIDQIETYKNRFGFYPESVYADKIYRTRDNLRYCKKYDIRVSGLTLGRFRSRQKKTRPTLRLTKNQHIRMKSTELPRNKLIVFADDYFGIFPSHEVFMPANVSVRDTEKELNITRDQIYAKYTELLRDKNPEKNKVFLRPTYLRHIPYIGVLE